MSLSNSRNCPQSLQPAPVVGKDLPVTCVTCSAIPAPSEGQIHLAHSMSFGFYLCSHQPLFSNMLHKRMKGWVEVVSATSAQNFPSKWQCSVTATCCVPVWPHHCRAGGAQCCNIHQFLQLGPTAGSILWRFFDDYGHVGKTTAENYSLRTGSLQQRRTEVQNNEFMIGKSSFGSPIKTANWKMMS